MKKTFFTKNTIVSILSIFLLSNTSAQKNQSLFTPKIETVNINQYSINDLKNNGCPRPPINININPIVDPIQWDYSKRSRDLQNIGKGQYSITGLHTGSLNINVQSQVFYLSDSNGNKTCYTFWPSNINIRLSSVIRVAQEATMLQCTKRTTEEHELQHHQVSLQALQKSQDLLNNRLNTLYAKPIFFNSYDEALNHYNSNIEHIKSQFLQQYSLIADPLNSQLDSPSNYERENKICSYELSTLAYYLSQP